MLDALPEHDNGNFELDGLVRGKCKASPEEIRAALDGELNPVQAKKFSVIRQHTDNSSSLKPALEKLILGITAKFQPQIDLLMPGISTPLTAIRHSLAKGERYNAALYRKADKPLADREFTTAQTIAFLRHRGFLIADEETGVIA